MRLAAIIASSLFAQPQLGFLNRGNPVLDAHNAAATFPPEALLSEKPTNYRRW